MNPNNVWQCFKATFMWRGSWTSGYQTCPLTYRTQGVQAHLIPSMDKAFVDVEPFGDWHWASSLAKNHLIVCFTKDWSASDWFI